MSFMDDPIFELTIIRFEQEVIRGYPGCVHPLEMFRDLYELFKHMAQEEESARMNQGVTTDKKGEDN